MLEVVLQVRLEVTGPVLSHSTAIGPLGIDAPMARRASDDVYYLPYSLVRGKLRQAWEELEEVSEGRFTDTILDGLGAGSDSIDKDVGGDFDPRRGRLHFTDFILEKDRKGESWGSSNVKHRVRINDDIGSAMERALQVLEMPVAPGERAVFTGTISFLTKEERTAQRMAQDVSTGLRWITGLGAERTVGFGRLEEVQVDMKMRPILLAPEHYFSGSANKLCLVIRPRDPLCVSTHPVTLNVFESDTVFSGALLRASLATILREALDLPADQIIDENLPAPWTELGRHFNELRFSHGFPVKKGAYRRPVVPPLSLVKPKRGGSRSWYDVALCDSPGLLGRPLRAPEFAVDWKDSNDVWREFGWGEPDRELRVRTAIDRYRRKAKEGDLFAYEMVLPDRHEWLAYIELIEIRDEAIRIKVEAQLRALLTIGLRSLGKTKARAEVEFIAGLPAQFPSNSQPLGSQWWVVTLQTPALLCDPEDLNETSGDQELFDAYQKVWGELSDSTLRLVRFFATQSLAGRYLVRRFMPSQPYNPFLLTSRGSVFVLEAAGDPMAAQSHIEGWLRRGVALPTWAVRRFGDTWRTCPFLPDDGYGEVAVNLPCHVQAQPAGEEWHAIPA